MAEMVHLRLESKIRKNVQSIVHEFSFSNESEFIRDAIRKNIETYDKLRSIKMLQNSVKQTKDHKKVSISEVFRQSGLEIK